MALYGRLMTLVMKLYVINCTWQFREVDWTINYLLLNERGNQLLQLHLEMEAGKGGTEGKREREKERKRSERVREREREREELRRVVNSN